VLCAAPRNHTASQPDSILTSTGTWNTPRMRAVTGRGFPFTIMRMCFTGWLWCEYRTTLPGGTAHCVGGVKTNWWDVVTGENRVFGAEHVPASLVHHKSHVDWPGFEVGLRGEWPASECLNHIDLDTLLLWYLARLLLCYLARLLLWYLARLLLCYLARLLLCYLARLLLWYLARLLLWYLARLLLCYLDTLIA
jgi:hypothetical protein